MPPPHQVLRLNARKEALLFRVSHRLPSLRLFLFFTPITTHLSYFYSFLQIIFPCDHNLLRAEVSQRQTYEVLPSQCLPYDLEKLLAKLIY